MFSTTRRDTFMVETLGWVVPALSNKRLAWCYFEIFETRGKRALLMLLVRTTRTRAHKKKMNARVG